MTNIIKRLVCTILSIAMLATIVLPANAAEVVVSKLPTETMSTETILTKDILKSCTLEQLCDLSNEVQDQHNIDAVFDEIIERVSVQKSQNGEVSFLTLSEYPISTDNDMTVISVSDGQEIVIDDDGTIVDTFSSKYRKIVSRCGDTTSVYHENITTGIATFSVNGVVIETYDMNDLRSNYDIWEMPEKDKALIQEALTDTKPGEVVTFPPEINEKYEVFYGENGSSCIIPVENNDKFVPLASRYDVRPYGAVTSTFPQYTSKEIGSKLQYSSVCGRNIDMSIKDSMCNYSRSSSSSKGFDVGTAVSYIAGYFKIMVSLVKGSLSGYVSTVSGILQLASNVTYYFQEKYDYYALRQGCVYDYTYNYTDVSVITHSGYGQISMTWDWNSSAGEYRNPLWKITSIAYPHQISQATIYADVMQAWEYNISEFGYWKWGNI